jgi:hydroxypyruvate isomerase
MKLIANISTLWRDLPLRERLERASQTGFDAYEFLFVETFGLDQMLAAKEEFGMKCALFDPDIGDPTFKTSFGYLCRPEAEGKFFKAVEEALEHAQRLDCQLLNTLVGEGVPGRSWEEQRDLVVQRLAKVAPDAADAGVTLLIEPISNQLLRGYLVNFSRQALELVDLVNHPNVRFQYDAFHMQLEEGNLISTVTGNLDKIAHVQVADVPGRHQPGTGEVNYYNFLKALQEAGYKGFVGLEYLPQGPDPFAWISELDFYSHGRGTA